MLQLSQIVKEYTVGGVSVPALRGVSVEFRKSEFVAVLGPSGCGKTTLLNIIGGLDRYTEGEMKINGVSTRQYHDRDWDTYRNHSVGFVFQNYNLIPHQSVLANVELALTLSGVSKVRRRALAAEALNKVGLGDQLKKRPNQMSGGQMQRVAIARALVNDPDILLADEPTGALDSGTSEQVMQILKEISKEKLVIMVTHNPDLAQRYATRTIRLLDGRIIDDTDPYESSEAPAVPTKRMKKPSMSFFTACSLSLNNLLTKKTRTLLTAFAGSIGIIGIALILSLSNGINLFIERVQQDTLSSYPLTIQRKSVDMTEMLVTMMGGNRGESAAGDRAQRQPDAVYTSPVLYDLWTSFFSVEAKTNDLKSFREYLQADQTEIMPHLSAIRYSYRLNFDTYVQTADGTVVSADAMSVLQEVYREAMGIDVSQYSGYMGGSDASIDVWEEFLTEKDGSGLNPVLKQQYDVLTGRWPEAYNEVVLVVNKDHEVSDLVLCTLGLKTVEELTETTRRVMNGEDVSVADEKWTFDEIVGKKIKFVPAAEQYRKDELSGSYTNLSDTQAGMEYLYNNEEIGVELTVCGILCPNEDAVSNMLNGSICYTAALTEYVMDRLDQQPVIRDQLADPETDVLCGLPFRVQANEPTESEKAEAFRSYLAELPESERVGVYSAVLCVPTDAEVEEEVQRQLGAVSPEQMRENLIAVYEREMGLSSDEVRNYIRNLDESTLMSYFAEVARRTVTARYALQMQGKLSSMTPKQIAAAYEARGYDDAALAAMYDRFLPSQYSEKTYEEVLDAIGYVDPETPDSVQLYCDTFNDKDAVSAAIERYNEGKEDQDQLKYTDYVKLIMSSVSSVLNAISYVLIAFVSISLVVSSIMIGIITYISVLERTKEIGILRSIGASKRDISRVFNAETLIVGFAAGLLGIGLTLLLTIPINIWIHQLSGLTTVNAVLPWAGGILLVLISMFLTFIAGLIPARIAAKKDPVEALRTE